MNFEHQYPWNNFVTAVFRVSVRESHRFSFALCARGLAFDSRTKEKDFASGITKKKKKISVPPPSKMVTLEMRAVQRRKAHREKHMTKMKHLSSDLDTLKKYSVHHKRLVMVVMVFSVTDTPPIICLECRKGRVHVLTCKCAWLNRCRGSP